MDHYVAFGFACNGGEHNLNDCPEPGAVAKYDHPDYAVAVRCGPGKYDASIDPKRDTPPQPHTSRPGTGIHDTTTCICSNHIPKTPTHISVTTYPQTILYNYHAAT